METEDNSTSYTMDETDELYRWAFFKLRAGPNRRTSPNCPLASVEARSNIVFSFHKNNFIKLIISTWKCPDYQLNVFENFESFEIIKILFSGV